MRSWLFLLKISRNFLFFFVSYDYYKKSLKKIEESCYPQPRQHNYLTLEWLRVKPTASASEIVQDCFRVSFIVSLYVCEKHAHGMFWNASIENHDRDWIPHTNHSGLLHNRFWILWPTWCKVVTKVYRFHNLNLATTTN